MKVVGIFHALIRMLNQPIQQEDEAKPTISRNRQPADHHERHNSAAGPQDVERIGFQRIEHPKYFGRSLGNKHKNRQDEDQDQNKYNIIEKACCYGGRSCEVYFTSDAPEPPSKARHGRPKSVHEYNQKKDREGRRTKDALRVLVGDVVMKNKSDPHPQKHAHENEVGKVTHVPNVSGQIANESQF